MDSPRDSGISVNRRDSPRDRDTSVSRKDNRDISVNRRASPRVRGISASRRARDAAMASKGAKIIPGEGRTTDSFITITTGYDLPEE